MGTNNNVTAELCHAICVMQTCQGSARYKISEFFLECTIGLYDMRVHNIIQTQGPANQCGNYRPVSLLSALSKILEKAVCNQLMSFLKNTSILCDQQFGFRPKNQTTHVVQHMMNIITEASATS